MFVKIFSYLRGAATLRNKKSCLEIPRCSSAKAGAMTGMRPTALVHTRRSDVGRCKTR